MLFEPADYKNNRKQACSPLCTTLLPHGGILRLPCQPWIVIHATIYVVHAVVGISASTTWYLTDMVECNKTYGAQPTCIPGFLAEHMELCPYPPCHVQCLAISSGSQPAKLLLIDCPHVTLLIQLPTETYAQLATTSSALLFHPSG